MQTLQVYVRAARIRESFCLSRNSTCNSIRTFRNSVKQHLPHFGWVLLAIQICSQAQFVYVTNADGITVTITDHTGPKFVAVTIPSTLRGLALTRIGTNAFDGSGIDSVIIHDSVTPVQRLYVL